MMSCPLLIRSMLERAGTLFPAVEIVSVKPDGSRARHTMRDLHRRARQLSAALQHAAIAPGDRVATIMWNQHEHLETYFGVPAIGAVIHTLNFRLHPDDIAFIIHHARDRFLIVDSTLLDVFEQLRSRVQFERVFVVDHSSAALPAGTESYEAFLASATHDPTYPDLAEDDAAAAIDPAELRAFLERRFARWQVPDDFVCVKELPYTATGKLLKSKLRQDFAAWQWDRP
jgi:fatty-acyl-CoA synthase